MFTAYLNYYQLKVGITFFTILNNLYFRCSKQKKTFLRSETNDSIIYSQQ